MHALEGALNSLSSFPLFFSSLNFKVCFPNNSFPSFFWKEWFCLPFKLWLQWPCISLFFLKTSSDYRNCSLILAVCFLSVRSLVCPFTIFPLSLSFYFHYISPISLRIPFFSHGSPFASFFSPFPSVILQEGGIVSTKGLHSNCDDWLM